MFSLNLERSQILENVKHFLSQQNRSQSNVKRKTVKKVKEKKRQNRISGLEYIEQPNLTIIVQSFNHVHNIEHIITRLRRTKAEEIIISEDGSVDGSHEKWMKYLDHPNDFLIHSNDLHEIRASDRAMRLAKGKIVCLIQDDDKLPDTGDWVDLSLSLFAMYPNLAILGGYQGLMWNDLDEDLLETKRKASIYGKGAQKIPFVAPSLGISFMFVEEVNIGPYFIQKEVFEKIGGWNFSYSKVGEPGIGFDHELCLRSWKAGYQVGLIGILERKAKDGGTFLWGLDERQKNKLQNLSKRIMFYRSHAADIRKAVDCANESLQIHNGIH